MALIEGLAEQAGKIGHYDRIMKGGGKAALLLLMLTARELDIPPMQALNGGLMCIDGRIEMSTHLMSAKIRQAGHHLEITFGKDDATGLYCKIKGKRRDSGDTLEVSYSMAHAQVAGLATRDMWRKYPREMCYARALGRIARMLFGDVIGGVYCQGEIDSEERVEPEIMAAPVEDPVEDLACKKKCTTLDTVVVDREKLELFRRTAWVQSFGGDQEAADKERKTNPGNFWRQYHEFGETASE